jgi:tRNA threonylcarbamoyl adenosine modification protein (Sua5/YciO/YrdC/YwlC family)
MKQQIKQACKEISNGNLVCFPTETVYALAADWKNEDAIEKIFQLKQRDNKTPLSILVNNVDNAKKIVEFNKKAEILAKKFCPGPLTMILTKKNNVQIPQNLNSGLSSIGVRIPNHEIAQEILHKCGGVVVATSVNLSGQKSLNCSADIINNFGNQVACIVQEYGNTSAIASTVVDLTSNDIKILRQGAITKEQILAIS